MLLPAVRGLILEELVLHLTKKDGDDLFGPRPPHVEELDKQKGCSG